MESGYVERRNRPRIALEEPVPAFIGHVVGWARPLLRRHRHLTSPGPRAGRIDGLPPLTWHGRGVYLRCSIIRSDVQRVGSAAYNHALRHSALQIANTIGDGDEILSSIISGIPR